MKFYFTILVSVLFGAFIVTIAEAAYVREPGEWGDWWSLGGSGEVRRIYDHENKLVCWVYSGVYKGGISCVPSLELDHPSTR